MRFIDRRDVAQLLPWADLVTAMEDVFRAGCEAPVRHHHALVRPDRDAGSLLLMPAWQPGRYTGVKIVHVVPGNAEAGLPAVHASYLLSDERTGAPLAVLDGGELTDRRTAATSVLAARYLARQDSRKLLILGSGRVARALAECYRATLPINDVAIWSRDPLHAERLARDLAAHGHPARAVASIDASQADIVAAATLSAEPLLRGAEVRAGTHVDLVGAFRPDMRESDGALLARAHLVVDTRAGALAEAGDIHQAIDEGAILADHVAAEFSELCRGTGAGRTRAEQVTVFKSVGWAGEDLAAAALAYDRAALS